MPAAARKFLVTDSGWQDHVIEKAFVRQGLLAENDQVAVQLRMKGEGGVKLTINTAGNGIENAEFVCDISIEDAAELAKACADSIFEKVRHLVVENGRRWEVDVYEGRLAGLTIAEYAEPETVALPDPLPDWIKCDLSTKIGYDVASLAKHGLPSSEKAP